MNALRYLLVKEYKQMFRNWFLPAIFVIVPIVFMNMVPRIATQEIDNLSIAVIDNDRSSASARLMQKISASRHFRLHTVLPDGAAHDGISMHEHCMRLMDNGDIDIILTIEHDFERHLYRTGQAAVAIDANAVNGMKGGLGSGYLMQIIMGYARELTAEAGISMQTPVDVSPRYLFNETLEYKVYMIPGLMIMILVLLVGFLPALNVVGEKEKGTIEQMNVTPVSRFEFILSKMIPYWTVGLFIIGVSMLMAWKVHGVAPRGSIALIFLFNIMGTLTVSSLALVVSNYSNTMRQAAMLMFSFLIVFILTSGLLSPISSMPEWAQELTRINPLRYLMAAMREIYLKGSTFTQLLPQFIPLCIFGALSATWAIMSYQKKE